MNSTTDSRTAGFVELHNGARGVRRPLNTEIRILDERTGICEYVASDESIDSYREVIRVAGWRFNKAAKNFPFVDSHDYSTIEKCLGKVIDAKVTAGELINTVQFAIDVVENKLAQLAWKMSIAKMLPAVSVGFMPISYFTKWDNNPTGYQQQLKELNLKPENGVTCIYVEQEQIELSLCVIGANPNAVAKAYKAGVLSDADLEMISIGATKREHDNPATDPADAELSRQRARTAFLVDLQTRISRL